ncbi:MAG: hypothetical protein ACR2RE_12480 [Geminicoccaceae bacterium]
MTREEFDEALLTFGTQLNRWPTDQCAAARRLLEIDDEARAMLEDMTSFESELGAAMVVDVHDGAIAARVQASVHERAEAAGLLSLLPLRWIFGFGSLAGLSGAAVAMATPVAINTSALLTLALTGGAP